jgi:hypothetical protein
MHRLMAVLQRVRDEIRPPRPPRGVDESFWARRDSYRHAYQDRIWQTVNQPLWESFRTTEFGITRGRLTFLGDILKPGGYRAQ